MVRRWLGNPASDLKILDKDTSLPALWKQDMVMELPKDRKYQNCLLRVRSRQSATVLNLKETEHMPENQIILQLVLMGDPVWLCLFKADFSDKSTVRGNLRVKVRIQDIDEIAIDKIEPKRLNIDFKVITKVNLENVENKARCSLYFDTPQKTEESRGFLEFNRKSVGARQSEKVEHWLAANLVAK